MHPLQVRLAALELDAPADQGHISTITNPLQYAGRHWEEVLAALAREVGVSYRDGGPLPTLRTQEGTWTSDRTAVTVYIGLNLGTLNELRASGQPQDAVKADRLCKELTQHWNCLSAGEKVEVLDAWSTNERVLSSGLPTLPSHINRGPANEWVAQTWNGTGPLTRAQLAKALKPETRELLVAATQWPQGGIDTSTLPGLGGRPNPSGLDTTGRPLPPVDPRTVGRYFKEPIGDWSGDRAALAQTVGANLSALSLLHGAEHTDRREQLHLEITLHWHCLSELEKQGVLERLGTEQAGLLGDTATPAGPDAPRTPVRDWLEHTAVSMSPERANRLLGACRPQAQGRLAVAMTAAHEDPAVKAVLKERFIGLRMTMPLDHRFDFGGFMKATGRVYGTLPEELQGKLTVCVVGGGPAGIVAADGLNRMGAKATVLEQHSEIGGRLCTVRLPGKDGATSPTPMEMGGMRFAPVAGNSYYALAQMFDTPKLPFPNPDSVQTSYLIGEQVFESDHGEPLNPDMKRVRDDYLKAVVAPLLLPIKQARDAGDMGTFQELCEEALERFDRHHFQGGLHALLKAQGIEWSERDWEIFGATGIGVGGYKGYFTTGFLEEFRFLADERLEEHVFFPGGANSPLHALVMDSTPMPDGKPVTSLEEQGAIRTGTEVTQIIKPPGSDKFQVTSVDKHSGESRTEEYDEVVFAAPPSEAIRLGLTGLQEGSERLMSPELAKAMEGARLVPATKLAVKVPKDLFENVDVPGNVQSNKPFQQMYVLPPIPGGESYTVFLSYQLGDNAVKTASMSGQEQFDLYVKMLKNAALASPDDPAYQKLKTLGEILEQGRDRLAFKPWGQEKHFGAAFKMDGPMQLENTKLLWNSLREEPKGVICANEMNTAEGGFASGAVNVGILAAQAIARKHGGELPPNSPLDLARA